MGVEPNAATKVNMQPDHPVEACGQRVGDRRVRLPRRERGIAHRIAAAFRRRLGAR